MGLIVLPLHQYCAAFSYCNSHKEKDATVSGSPTEGMLFMGTCKTMLQKGQMEHAFEICFT